MSRAPRAPIYAIPVAEGARFTVGDATAFAVRREEKDIALRIRRERRPLREALGRIPFVRGIQRLFRATFGLLDCLGESGELYPQRISRGNRLEQGMAELFQFESESLVGLLSGVMIILLMAVFVLGLPMAVQRYILPGLELTGGQMNGIMCLIRILGLWLWLFACMRLRIVKRLCMYRGAVNKVLNAYEANRRAPNLKEAMAQSRIYRRSDEAFLLVVLALSIVGFSLIRTFTLPIQLLVRVMTILLVAALVNEPIQALEHYRLSRLLAPFRGLERLFVMEPHEQMVEVALCAFNAARENNER